MIYDSALLGGTGTTAMGQDIAAAARQQELQRPGSHISDCTSYCDNCMLHSSMWARGIPPQSVCHACHSQIPVLCCTICTAQQHRSQMRLGSAFELLLCGLHTVQCLLQPYSCTFSLYTVSCRSNSSSGDMYSSVCIRVQ